MKKLLVLVFCSILILTGCSCSISGNTPTKKAQEFLMRYKDLNESVVSDLELSSETVGLTTSDHKGKYVDVMKRQYKDMTYEVQNEEVNGDDAEVDVKVTVYDLYKARKTAEAYTTSHSEEFYKSSTDTVRDIVKVNDYILNKLNTMEEKVDYTITLKLKKIDSKWEVQELNTETKEKIHGTYNYESK